jgi:DNA invertase Pin-like site-specific DNA recombinase
MKGDSLRRQTAAGAEWCARNQVRLDESLTLHDLGKSAYTGTHRTNPDRNALALFLKLVEKGRVRPGDYLLIENLDRLSREDEVPACHLLTGILMAGVRVVQLSPYEMLLTEKSNGWELMRAVMELSRGHNESAIKSERIGKAWAQKKHCVREGKGGELLTRALPAWVEERGGRLHLIPERAAVVKRIFGLAGAGYGLRHIVKKLAEDKVPPFGGREIVVKADGEPEMVKVRGKLRPRYRAVGRCYGAGVWVRAYVAAILKDRRAVGELQPCGKGRKPEGPPVPGYFPAVVSEEEFQAARAGARQRRTKAGRIGRHVNPFSGLLWDARGGGPCYVTSKGEARGRIIVSGAAAEGRAPYVSFPAHTFERGVFALLREIDPREILEGVNGHDELMALEGELTDVESSVLALEAELDARGESPVLFRRLRQKEARQAELVKLLAEARQRAAHPLSASWGEARSLLEAIDTAPDPEDVRVRLRGALRRIIESVWLLPVPRGRDRLCAAQIYFSGGERHRDYLIYHKAAGGGRKGSWWAKSLASVADPDDLDLRRREDAAALEQQLAEVDLARLTAG